MSDSTVAALRPPHSRWRRVPAVLALGLLSGCKMVLFDPRGDIGAQEKHLILVSLGLMLAVVIPVIALTLYFFWRYRETNTEATYSPDWAHSTRIEVVVWAIPCVIVAFLAVLIWRTTHSLDPYRPIESTQAPVRVDVVALNWKWLFIYPDYGIATVNQLTLPVNTPVNFRLTADSIMNSFFIPQLGSQVYAMAGMQTKLHLISDHEGVYDGRSAAYSGSGFSDMHFKTTVTSRGAFDAWVTQVRAEQNMLDKPAYRTLAQPETPGQPAIYANVDPTLFDSVVNQYMQPTGLGDMCGPQARPTAGAMSMQSMKASAE
ncbi:cytochrome o ubiquinol oxidase subunit 2 [Luteibacter sp. Sphag1AF]|uniref:ubiquinol oxidase subunit II n=1 Tax=Luteibacter sp. Sphag1AF TaxID=2587031 RepID=UPI0016144A84|nr:ubiquinol oxidase subunit II [Luteibacter sp. Sphag1AF]MBB3228535.1 cytochrome o ubiquinol oxidase subunit 2 [Luteibacter sp. Sphag1AF]